ncbi:MAG: hypothetical protein AB1791_07795 [Chloroflexota bacterium]
MDTITLKLPESLATQLETTDIDEEQLDTFLIAAVEAWLQRRQKAAGQFFTTKGNEKSFWSDAFRGNGVAFVDQLIDDNLALFEELAGV